MLASDPPLGGEKLLSAVTEAMVALHDRYYHRTPVSAKTRMLGDDLLACVLGGVYTEVERTMTELKCSTVVQETRSAFQIAMQHRFIDEVEHPSGRGVLALISNSHAGPNIEIQLFMLASPEAPARASAEDTPRPLVRDSEPVREDRSESLWPLDTVSAAMLAMRTIDDIDHRSGERRNVLLAGLTCAAWGSPWAQNQ